MGDTNTIFIECTKSILSISPVPFIQQPSFNLTIFPSNLYNNIIIFIMYCVRYRFYKARKQLAAIDWNYHCDRPAAVGAKGGEARYSRKYNQRTKEWNTRVIKVDKDFAYIPILMAKIFRRRTEDILPIDRHVSLSEDDPERIAPTIAHTAAISSKELFERHKTRFQRQIWNKIFNKAELHVP